MGWGFIVCAGIGIGAGIAIATQPTFSVVRRAMGVMLCLVLVASIVWASLTTSLIAELALIGRAW